MPSAEFLARTSELFVKQVSALLIELLLGVGSRGELSIVRADWEPLALNSFGVGWTLEVFRIASGEERPMDGFLNPSALFKPGR